jgi:hypothetical protein
MISISRQIARAGADSIEFLCYFVLKTDYTGQETPYIEKLLQ